MDLPTLFSFNLEALTKRFYDSKPKLEFEGSTKTDIWNPQTQI